MNRFTEEEKCILRIYFREDAVDTAEEIYRAMDLMEECPEKELMRSSLRKILTSEEDSLKKLMAEPPLIPAEEDQEER